MRFPTTTTLRRQMRRSFVQTIASNNNKKNTISKSYRFLSSSTSSSSPHEEYFDENGLTKFNTLHEMQVRSCALFADNDLFGTYDNFKESFEYMTYADYDAKVDSCRKVLMDLGVQEYDKVAIISNNRWEWATIAAAAYSLSATLVPMYEAQLEADWTYILNDCNASVVICATQDIFHRVRANVLPATPSIHACLCLDDDDASDLQEEYSFPKLMDAARQSSVSPFIHEPTPEDLADLIYTSGTTGKPKGVELTHLNITSNVKASRNMASDPHDFVRQSDRSLAFLPWAHSYGQTCELWNSISMGSGMAICRGVPYILEDLQLVKPTVLLSVPTLYNKVYDGVHNLMENANPIRKSLMRSALDLGSQNADYRNGKRADPLGLVDSVKFKMLDRIVLSKIRDRFGGNLRHGFVAGAACAPEVLQFMDSLGIPICEGYGLTETSPIITINVPERRSIGSVGQPIGDVNVYIIDPDTGLPVTNANDEGEICCVGPNIMRGYHNKPEATDEVISVAPDGVSRMFHTGDLGRMDENGWVKVTGRIKEQYKLDNGKYIVPTPIETAIGMSRFISQVVLCGANRPFNIALIVPDWVAIQNEFFSDRDNNNVDDTATLSEEEMANDSRVTELIDQEIAKGCQAGHIKKFEIPQKWAFVAPFTAENNMLTPKMSIKRHKVMEAYEDVINHVYGDENNLSAHPNKKKTKVVPSTADGASSSSSSDQEVA